MLDAYCRHYLSLGIRAENFLLVLNSNSSSESNIEETKKILGKYSIQAKDTWMGTYESEEKWRRVDRLLTKYIQKEDWVVHPDADEFHEIPSHSYNDLFSDFEKRQINAVQGILIDRLAANKKIPVKKSIENPFEEFPVCANLSSVLKIPSVKLLAYKGYLRANNGSGQIHPDHKSKTIYPHGKSQSYHETSEFIKWIGDPDYCNKPTEPKDFTLVMDQIKKEIKFIVHHFKWHGHVKEKLIARINTYKILNRAQWVQSDNALKHYEEFGCFNF